MLFHYVCVWEGVLGWIRVCSCVVGDGVRGVLRWSARAELSNTYTFDAARYSQFATGLWSARARASASVVCFGPRAVRGWPNIHILCTHTHTYRHIQCTRLCPTFIVFSSVVCASLVVAGGRLLRGRTVLVGAALCTRLLRNCVSVCVRSSVQRATLYPSYKQHTNHNHPVGLLEINTHKYNRFVSRAYRRSARQIAPDDARARVMCIGQQQLNCGADCGLEWAVFFLYCVLLCKVRACAQTKRDQSVECVCGCVCVCV